MIHIRILPLYLNLQTDFPEETLIRNRLSYSFVPRPSSLPIASLLAMEEELSRNVKPGSTQCPLTHRKPASDGEELYRNVRLRHVKHGGKEVKVKVTRMRMEGKAT